MKFTQAHGKHRKFMGKSRSFFSPFVTFDDDPMLHSHTSCNNPKKEEKIIRKRRTSKNKNKTVSFAFE